LVGFARGVWSYGGFTFRESGYPQIFSAPSGETVHQTPKVLEVQERARGPLSPRQVSWGSDFTRRRGGQKRCVFYRHHCAKGNLPSCRYLIYSEADFEVFRPAGATRCTDGGEIWHGAVPNFTPIGATTRV